MRETPPLEADEREVRHQLRKLGVGPDAITPPPIPPKPAVLPQPVRERDWLDDILNAPATPEPAQAPTEKTPTSEPKPAAGKPKRQGSKPPKAKPRRIGPRPKSQGPAGPRTAWDTRPPAPRQSLTEAFDRIPYRLKWLAYHTAAAAAGWRVGIVHWATDTAAWYAQGHWASPSAWVCYALGVGACALYRRSRPWAWPVAWAAAIPASSVVVGVLLYGATS